MKALALALLLTQAPPADAPVQVPCRDQLVMVATELHGERARSAALEQSLKDMPSTRTVVIVSGIVGLVIGAGLAVLVYGLASKR